VEVGVDVDRALAGPVGQAVPGERRDVLAAHEREPGADDPGRFAFRWNWASTSCHAAAKSNVGPWGCCGNAANATMAAAASIAGS
jgi:hypothetical protein